MAFTQSLSFCQTNNCQTLTVTDQSNYGDTISLGDVTQIVMSFVNYDGSTTDSVDVTTKVKEQMSGTVDATAGTNTITGTTTAFSTEFAVGNKILIGDYFYTIKQINSDTEMLIMELFGESPSGADIYLIDFEFDLDSTDIQEDTVATFINDGIYSITYTVTADGTDYVYETSKEFVCQAECCVLNKLANATETWLKDPCDTKNLEEANFANALLQGLKTGAYSGSQAEFETILAGVQQYCEFTTSGCSSCS